MGSGPSLPIAASREASELRERVCVQHLVCQGEETAWPPAAADLGKMTDRAFARVHPLSLKTRAEMTQA